METLAVWWDGRSIEQCQKISNFNFSKEFKDLVDIWIDLTKLSNTNKKDLHQIYMNLFMVT